MPKLPLIAYRTAKLGEDVSNQGRAIEYNDFQYTGFDLEL